MTPDHPSAIPTPSPNCGDRRGGARPDMIVLHYTGMESCAAAHERLCDPGAEVSAHYLVSETGALWQLVPEAQRAWHAGAGHWAGVTDVNSRSIGIELVNTGNAPFPEPQMTVLEELMRGIMARWSIEAHRVIAHSDMAPARKSDPGPRFDWRRLALSGLSVWPEPADGGDFLGAARRFGYPPDATPEETLAAFRLRFRPWASGPVDATDAALAADLARRFPVDREASSA
ncbi:N-acetylmuramoyl-L-alanine amidase [Roseovarius sp.]|uniref:N-acetylmuramoyl-L-alanine amidase n=1 Tax=Roseovarius sp. TaxID=1486281 RepID=UPI003BAC78B9